MREADPWLGVFIDGSPAAVRAGPTYIRCAFTAWDEDERQLFHGYLPLAEVSFPAGVYLERHEKRSIDWYFDAHAHPQARRDTQVARYSSSCTRVMNPPI
jgi:hypothetical protein